ncbi:MAG: hypothetical protein J1E57_03795 [Prevotella sp.]|nr:hypothetical protein [Prevotella sp.]
MKKMMILAVMIISVISANAISFTQARNEALFLSDKMAYELNLTDAQYNAVYEINLDYIMSVNSKNDVFGVWWDRRNADLRYILTPSQYNRYIGMSYFYKPLSWNSGNWTFNIYSRYTNRNSFYKAHPNVYTSYKGGNNKKTNYYANRKLQQNNVNGTHWRNINGSNTRITANKNTNNHSIGNNRPMVQNTHKLIW